MESGKRGAVRLIPCADYDIEGLQSYFEEMAAKGLHLKKDGIFAYFAAFERGEPREARYRMDVKEKRSPIMDGDNGRPTDEQIELCNELGWEYVDSIGAFHIFRTYDAAAPELNTDAALQSIAARRIVRSQIESVLVLCFWLLIYPVLKLDGLLLPTMFTVGTDVMLLAYIIDIWWIVGSIARLVYLSRIKKRLEAGESIVRRVKRSSVRYIAPRIAFAVLAAVTVCLFIARWSEADKGRVPLEEYAGELPFATIADIVPGKYERMGFPVTDGIQVRSDILAPVVIDFREYAAVTVTGGKAFSGGLLIDYYETVSPRLARAAAEELLLNARLKRHYTPIELDDTGADMQAAYYDEVHMPTVILQKGNRVIKATLYQTGEYTISMDEWAGKLLG